MYVTDGPTNFRNVNGWYVGNIIPVAGVSVGVLQVMGYPGIPPGGVVGKP